MPDVYSAMSSPTRRDIISLLKEKDMTAGELSEHFKITKPTLSGHLNILHAADLVTRERSGTTITYGLNTSVMEELLSGLIGLLSQNKQEPTND